MNQSQNIPNSYIFFHSILRISFVKFTLNIKMIEPQLGLDNLIMVTRNMI